MSQTIGEYIKRRNEALANLDLAWARSMVNPAADNGALLISMHKARVEISSIPADLRFESIKWLQAHGYSRLGHLPFPPPGELPE